MNCKTQFFMIFSIEFRIIEICLYRLSEILLTRFATFKNIEFFYSNRKKIKTELMYRFIKKSFRQN
jgi:hypothetical protein